MVLSEYILALGLTPSDHVVQPSSKTERTRRIGVVFSTEHYVYTHQVRLFAVRSNIITHTVQSLDTDGSGSCRSPPQVALNRVQTDRKLMRCG